MVRLVLLGAAQTDYTLSEEAQDALEALEVRFKLCIQTWWLQCLLCSMLGWPVKLSAQPGNGSDVGSAKLLSVVCRCVFGGLKDHLWNGRELAVLA